ncbi:uncharacterized protein Z518_02207 [Rhinocladiella mackenziei CBS 650.93]|uniref:CFEM domain-containing protein n=1 Tax=Rhinocladiella mackenziei CBS 650.93 TaxID=1442369 RepID=A0A0D2IP14_9EURO|nr:uncharacterized protein Z518_02207 [Rhinocladiella mackenziei CBS 650.93]KIX07554.1 hypothetical protein Z518_02207 [Rhinocladiella mackenziei CBS 650.93]
MYLTLLGISTLLTGIASAQSLAGLPTCICTSESFLDGIACCVFNDCEPADQQSALDYAHSICDPEGASSLLPATAGCSSTSGSATATGSSNSSATATAGTTGTGAAASASSSASSALSGITSSASSALSSASATVSSVASEASASVTGAAASATSSPAAGNQLSVRGVGLGVVGAGLLGLAALL